MKLIVKNYLPHLNNSTGDVPTNLSKSKVGDRSRGWPEGSFSIATIYTVEEGATPFSGLLHFTLDSNLIMLSVKQGSIKYHFLSLWYDSTWDWTQVSGPLANTLTIMSVVDRINGLVQNCLVTKYNRPWRRLVDTMVETLRNYNNQDKDDSYNILVNNKQK